MSKIKPSLEIRKLEDVVSAREFQRIRDSVTFVDFTKTADKKNANRPENRVIRKPQDCDQEYLLTYLRYKDWRTLKHDHYQQLILAAAKQDDFDFFVKLGKVLNKKTEDHYKNFNKLEWFLVTHWCEQHDNLPELCRLTGGGLTDVCRSYLKNNSLTHEIVVKNMQRLGLIRTKNVKAKIHTTLEGGSLQFSP